MNLSNLIYQLMVQHLELNHGSKIAAADLMLLAVAAREEVLAQEPTDAL